MRIALTTTGGDAPGLNAAIEGVTRAARRRGWDVVGLRDGFDSLLEEAGDLVDLDVDLVAGLRTRGGTILGAANTHDPTGTPDGPARIAAELGIREVDALVVVGGDGSQRAAARVHDAGVRVVGVPKTIDHDLARTEATLGFETAVEFAAGALQRLRDTADAHHRVFVVEVMGRDAGWLALHGGLAGDADAILLPEIEIDPDGVAEGVKEVLARRGCAMVVVAEGVAVRGGYGDGAAAARVAGELRARLDDPVREISLGHLLRGGTPVALDRVHGLRLGAAAVEAIGSGMSGVLVAWDGSGVVHVPLKEVAGLVRRVDAENVTLRTARQLGVVLGERAN